MASLGVPKEYWDTKFPARGRDEYGLFFYWQCAIAGGMNYHYVLHGPVWEELSDYYEKENSSLYKKYRSADVALRDLYTAVNLAGDSKLW